MTAAMTLELFDIGANLTNKAFRADLHDVLARARAAGVRLVAIERLTREQETLREELESAGDMIERLGKELELT